MWIKIYFFRKIRLIYSPPNQGGSTKQKCCILISAHCFPIPLPYGIYQKNLTPLGYLEGLPLAPLKMALIPTLVKKKKFGLQSSRYSNRPAQTQSLNAKIRFKKYAPSPKISAKKCQILLVWFGRPIFYTFLVISWDWVHIFQNRFLH